MFFGSRISSTPKFKYLFREDGILKNWLDKNGRLKTLFVKDGIFQKVYAYKKGMSVLFLILPSHMIKLLIIC